MIVAAFATVVHMSAVAYRRTHFDRAKAVSLWLTNNARPSASTRGTT